MSPAFVCRKCNEYIEARHWCMEKGIFRSPWDDMCEPGLIKYKARNTKNENLAT